MSVIINGIDMPECCIDCPIYNDEYGVCNLLPNNRNYYEDENWCDPFEERRKDCPLQELKEKKDMDIEKIIKILGDFLDQRGSENGYVVSPDFIEAIYDVIQYLKSSSEETNT